MEKDFTELIEYLDEKFNNIDEQLVLKAEKTDLDELKKSVDAYALKADTYFQEMIMLSNKIDRQEKWIHILADKLRVKLEY